MTDDASRPTDIRERNRDVIARYRATGGTGEGLSALLLLTTIGNRSGKPHTTPVCVQEDGDRLVIAGSMGGLPTNPQWYRNILAHPEVTVEHRGRMFRARATTVPNGPERDVLFARMNEVIPGLYGYQDRAAPYRQIPVVVLEPLPS
ncbi:MAG TPA: nitroreductase/quinone reductase family protein [Acidimicrobiales bacterium]|nr:nitroreductase/quinone reductase family protein [Acidimicrobiales bacterium]